LLSTLYILQRAEDPDAAVHAYELQWMALVGYEPQLIECIRCERLFNGNNVRVAAYAPARGGALCDECAATVKDETLRLSSEAHAMLIRLRFEENARALATVHLPEGEGREEIARVLRAHLRYRLERDVRSTAFLDALRVGAMDDPGALMDDRTPPT